MTTVILWFLFGIIGAGIIFYEDLKVRMQWVDEADITLGEALFYIALSLFGPIVFYFALKMTDTGGQFMKHFDALVVAIADLKVYTFKKRHYE